MIHIKFIHTGGLAVGVIVVGDLRGSIAEIPTAEIDEFGWVRDLLTGPGVFDEGGDVLFHVAVL